LCGIWSNGTLSTMCSNHWSLRWAVNSFIVIYRTDNLLLSRI